MSFLQENRTDTRKCGGCEKQCEFNVVIKVRCHAGTSIGSGHRLTATIEDMYPVLRDTPIYHYVDETGRHIYPWVSIRNNIVEIEGKLVVATSEVRSKLQLQMVEHAKKVSKRCNHYKTR